MPNRAHVAFSFFLSLTCALICPRSAFANVSLKNGNFFIGYTDMVFNAGLELKVERVYNSKTPFSGIFGAGWGFDYEVFLEEEADASITVHEYGGGAQNEFHSYLTSPHLELADIHRARSALNLHDPDPTQYDRRLLGDSGFRHDEWRALDRRYPFHHRALLPGTRLVSNRFSHQEILRLPRGYVRYFDNGVREVFREDGRLEMRADRNGNTITIERDPQSRISALVDNFGHRISFAYGAQNLVSLLTDSMGRTARYSYNPSKELIRSIDTDGNAYMYQWSIDGRHNLTAVGYSDGTDLTANYSPPVDSENIRLVRDRDGTSTTYRYGGELTEPPRYFWTKATVQDAQKHTISTSAYEYFERPDELGRRTTDRLITTTDGERTDTTYDRAGNPLLIIHDFLVTSFVYDSDGRVTRKESPEEITTLEYGPLRKVIRVTKTSHHPGQAPTVSWSAFAYDTRGNLVGAEDSQGRKLTLEMDDKGRISAIVDNKASRRVELRIGYDAVWSSKPALLEVVGVGSIRIAYTPTGDMSAVTPSPGSEVAHSVTDVYSTLLDVIKPAGVQLSF
jgi:YD repeat-containing protein